MNGKKLKFGGLAIAAFVVAMGLSACTGENGVDGQPGKDGIDGIDGADGVDITSLEKMLNSRMWMWSGNGGKATVTISEKEEALWLAYGDADLGGETFFTWENSINWYGSDNKLAVKDLSSYCNSICGTANFVESGITDGSGNYYAGIGFKMNPTDITSWNGFTVIYSSDMDLTLGIEEINRSKYEYDDYRAKLPKAAEPQMLSLTWEDFAQSGVGTSQPLEKILKQVNMIDLQYFTKTAAKSNFKIYAIGKNE